MQVGKGTKHHLGGLKRCGGTASEALLTRHFPLHSSPAVTTHMRPAILLGCASSRSCARGVDYCMTKFGGVRWYTRVTVSVILKLHYLSHF